MTRDAWDWEFLASFAEEPALSDEGGSVKTQPWLPIDHEEPTASRALTPAGQPTNAPLAEHLVKLREARTHEERQAAAAEALTFLNEARRRERRTTHSGVDDGPTLVDEQSPLHMLHPDFLGASSSAPTPRP